MVACLWSYSNLSFEESSSYRVLLTFVAENDEGEDFVYRKNDFFTIEKEKKNREKKIETKLSAIKIVCNSLSISQVLLELDYFEYGGSINLQFHKLTDLKYFFNFSLIRMKINYIRGLFKKFPNLIY